MTAFSDTLIVCGQGVYKDGAFYTEYADRDVYVRHAVTVAAVVDAFRYTHVVCSGGFTQWAAPDISEATSLLSLWEEFGCWPVSPDRVFRDEISLDSAENLVLGLMAARLGLGDAPIRRVGVYCAWKFKKTRFNNLAEDLGILERFYFHGLAQSEEANAGSRALEGERAQLGEMSSTNDHLMLSPSWEQKRKSRYQGADYGARLVGLRRRFRLIFSVLDGIRERGMTDELRCSLRAALQGEVLLHGFPRLGAEGGDCQSADRR